MRLRKSVYLDQLDENPFGEAAFCTSASQDVAKNQRERVSLIAAAKLKQTT